MCSAEVIRYPNCRCVLYIRRIHRCLLFRRGCSGHLEIVTTVGHEAGVCMKHEEMGWQEADDAYASD